ncbi:3D domain-containing protein [Patescibacteria group bacterium]|nr:3D domain-containing protein [Patescibacteria group bacterium]MBU4453391.1 3D domain-containing protein [Patescibacteria group bacterium]
MREPAYTITVPATAYNSLAGQTDDTPFITASGTTTRHGVLAANFLPIGTRVKIPEIYGDDIFIVEDRMNARYNKRVDIWMENYDDAIQFGYKNIQIEVYPNK